MLDAPRRPGAPGPSSPAPRAPGDTEDGDWDDEWDGPDADGNNDDEATTAYPAYVDLHYRPDGAEDDPSDEYRLEDDRLGDAGNDDRVESYGRRARSPSAPDDAAPDDAAPDDAGPDDAGPDDDRYPRELTDQDPDDDGYPRGSTDEDPDDDGYSEGSTDQDPVDGYPRGSTDEDPDDDGYPRGSTDDDHRYQLVADDEDELDHDRYHRRPHRSPLPPGPPGPPRRPSQVPRAVVLKQRRRRRRFLIGLTFFLSASVSMVGSGYVYLQYRLGQIPRVDVPALVGDSGGIMNVLLVGSDSRAGLEGRDKLQAGTISGRRSDTIMVLHIDQQQEQAAILSIPRDLYLPIAGEDYSDRVNAAYAVGGAQGLIETIQESLGITINHYVEVDFVGFKDIVDAVGGVKLYLPAWARDFTSGLDLPYIGCVSVNGSQGLAWVRSREFEYLVDGVWIPDPRADLGRIERQQDFIRRMLKKALSSGITNPLQLNRLIGIGVRDVTLDETLSTKDLTTLARRFNDLDPNSVALLTLPTTPDEVDGASVLQLREDEAKPYLDHINGVGGSAAPTAGEPGTTTTLPAGPLLYPGDFDVRVLNGEGTPGAAGQAAAALQQAGFNVVGTDDAVATSRTTIRYSSDAATAAQLLEGALLGGANLVLDSVLTSADVVLVIGADYQGLNEGEVAPVPLPATTTTIGTGSTTPTVAPTTTLPPTTLAPPTLPPGVEC